MTKCRVDQLRIGQRVDLEADMFADPDYFVAAENGEVNPEDRSEHIEWQFEFEAVAAIERETDDCIRVDFESGFACGFPPDHEVDVDGEQTFTVPLEAREPLPVIFRAERSGDFKGDVTAVFPTLPGMSNPYTFTVYAHVGQHGCGSKEWYNGTRAAKPDEYADLLAELREIYECDDDSDAVRLVVCKRFTQAHDKARREALR